jgi:DNA-binding transcriptional LysR family regulator
MQDELVLITSPSHRLAGLKQVQVSDLAGEFLIVQGTKSLLRRRFVQALQDSETPFNVCVENIAIEAIKRMVAQDLGIGFVPLMCVREEMAGDRLVTVSVVGVPNEWKLWLVHRRGQALSPAARTLVDIILAIARSKVGGAYSARPEGANVRKNKRESLAIDPRRVVRC